MEERFVELREFPWISHPYGDSCTKIGRFFTGQEGLQQSEGSKMLVGSQVLQTSLLTALLSHN